jgi:hypothetical protein
MSFQFTFHNNPRHSLSHILQTVTTYALLSKRTTHAIFHTVITCAIFSTQRKIPHIPSPCLFRMKLFLTPPRHFLAYPNFWQRARIFNFNRESDCQWRQFCAQSIFLSCTLLLLLLTFPILRSKTLSYPQCCLHFSFILSQSLA